MVDHQFSIRRYFGFIFFVVIFFAVFKASAQTLQNQLIHPQQFILSTGSKSNIPVDALSRAEQSGTEDCWTCYQEYFPRSARFSGRYVFKLPIGISAKQIKSLNLIVNFKGSTYSVQPWLFDIYNFSRRGRLRVGDNRAAQSWVWSSLRFPITYRSGLKSFVNSRGEISIYLSSIGRDNADIDYLALEIGTESTQPPTQPPIGSSWTVPAVDNSHFLNPERGFMKFRDLTVSSFTDIRPQGTTLAYARVDLEEFVSSSIPASFLREMEAGFQRARAEGIKVIPRFVYNKEGEEKDAPLGRILSHIEQVRPILARNADVILVLQAGFIGRWGEWHGSPNNLDNDSSRRQILNALLTALPASRMVQVRTPLYKTGIFQNQSPLTAGEAFNGTARARVGHVNDCFLANNTDEGTYPPDKIEFWKQFIADETRYVPMGGETCAVGRTSCEEAIPEMRRLHFSDLNDGFRKEVIAGWKADGCYAQMQKELGYRFRLKEFSMLREARSGTAAQLSFKIENSGFASLFNARPAHLVLVKDGVTYPISLSGAGSDPRYWAAGTTSVYNGNIQIPAGMAPGTYRVALWLPDAASSLARDSRYSIRLANVGMWDSVSGLNYLPQTLVIR